MQTQEAKMLAEAIRDLKLAAERVARLSRGLQVAEMNIYMIQRQIEMLEIEICDPVSVLDELGTGRKE